jgi:hypothetical protein
MFPSSGVKHGTPTLLGPSVTGQPSLNPFESNFQTTLKKLKSVMLLVKRHAIKKQRTWWYSSTFLLEH